MEEKSLRHFLGSATGFSLAIALYNDPAVRAAILRRLDGLPGITLRVVDLHASKETSLSAAVAAAVADIPPGTVPGVMVVNLESRVPWTPGLGDHCDASFLQTANLHRELLPGICHGPVVLWVTELIDRAIVTHATDLWRWRSHHFDLRSRTNQAVPALSPEGLPWHHADDRLPPAARISRLEAELAAYRKAAMRQDEVRTLNSLGVAYLHAGDAQRALGFFELATMGAQEIGDRLAEGNAWGNMGNAHFLFGDARRALECHQKAMLISQGLGDRRSEARVLGNMGIVHDALGDFRRALECHEESLKIAREIGDPRGVGAALGNIGNALYALGDPRRAIECHLQHLRIAQETGDRRGEGAAWGNMGVAHRALGDTQRAIQCYERRMELAQENGDWRGEAQAWGGLGGAHASLGDFRQALECCEKQRLIAQEIGDPRGKGHALFNSARILWALNGSGERQEAKRRMAEAAKILASIAAPQAEEAREMLENWEREGA